MENISIYLGYIHPTTKAWHSKVFTDVGEARDALRVLARHHIPVAYASFTDSNYPKFNCFGCTEEEFIGAFIQRGGEYDIDFSHKDNIIPELICDWIRSRTINDTVTINGHTYTVEEDYFKQDEQWAEAYNSYSGYDKVLRWTVASATDEDVYVEFYTDL